MASSTCHEVDHEIRRAKDVLQQLNDACVRSCPRRSRCGQGRCHGAEPAHRRFAGHDLHLSDASTDSAERSGKLPDLRHGAGAGGAQRGFRTQPRTARHDKAILDQRGTGAADVGIGDGRPSGAEPASACVRGSVDVDSVRARYPGGAVGRVAVLRARVGIGREPVAEHVQFDRPRSRRRIPLQPGGDVRSRPVPVGAASRERSHSRLLRSRGRDHGARAAGPGARTAGPGADGRRHPRPAEIDAEDRAAAEG